MANSIFFVSFLILSITFSLPSIANGKPDGFTIKLIHRDSPESPFYKPNLTRAQRIERLILQSRARVVHLLSSDHDFHGRPIFKAEAVRANIDYQQITLFMAQVGIGTFTTGSNSSFSYFLHIDTGSALIWIQCEVCKDPGHHCFHQKEPFFPDKQSTSYRKLLCNRHPLCFPRECIGNFCSYYRDYADNSSTRGYLAIETFRFDSNATQKEVVPDIVFGCDFDQVIDYGDEGNIAGLMALGWSKISLVTQLGSKSNNRFSYCLQTMNGNHSQNTYLRFGSDIPQTPSLKTTELTPRGERFAHYYVTLLDMRIANSRLKIPSYYFGKRYSPDETIIDSRASYTYIVKPTYRILEQEMVKYLSRIGGLRRTSHQHFNLCYERSSKGQGFNNLPNVTFHFRGADLGVQPQGAFEVDENKNEMEFFCLAMFPYFDDSSPGSIIGAYQQTNHRFIFDINQKK